MIAAPIRELGEEWHFVVVAGEVVAGSAYQADGRVAGPETVDDVPWRFAAEVTNSIPQPEDVYILDVCIADGELRLLELNPFSGADLYNCDGTKIARAVANLVTRASGSSG